MSDHNVYLEVSQNSHFPRHNPVPLNIQNVFGYASDNLATSVFKGIVSPSFLRLSALLRKKTQNNSEIMKVRNSIENLQAYLQILMEIDSELDQKIEAAKQQ